MSKHLNRLAVALLLAAPQAWAATPATGEINDSTPVFEWTGDGPYVFTNLTPFAAGADSVQCDPAVPVLCDEFVITVNISDEFRGLEANQRESVKIGIEFPQDPGGQVDYDLYVYDSAGTLVGESAGSAPQSSEAVTVPLKSLKNGTYSVQVIPFTPLGTNYTGVVQLGKPAAKDAASPSKFGGGAFGVLALLGLAAFGAARRSGGKH